MRAIICLPLIALAACATPRESCERGVTRNIRVIDGLIAETEGNLRRGYALREQPAVIEGLDVCGRIDGRLTFCTTRELTSRTVAQAINLDDEQATLASLRRDRSARATRAAAALAECRARYPAS